MSIGIGGVYPPPPYTPRIPTYYGCGCARRELFVEPITA